MYGFERFDDSLFWTLTSPEGATSMVVGTVHVLDSSHISMPLSELEAELSRLRHLYVEIDPEEMKRLKSESEAGGLGVFASAGGTPATPKQLQRVAKIAESSPRLAPLSDQLATLPTTILTHLIKVETQLRSELFETADLELEDHFIAYATEHDIPVSGLEEAADQFAHVNADDDLDAALDAYDDPQSEDMFLNYAFQHPELLSGAEMRSEAMVTRNAALAVALETKLRKNPGLVLIGAAHLPLDTGVLAVLENKEWDVGRVELTVENRR
ncbi:TraB/GumN family protein [Corynebacterium glaucum]|uniref:TraB/GumN family protein n=1 Tax=Corynebacterium glaucum TaxID=187491 RepID=UPI0025B3770F|nr:TraB/GumN family protein [Corynebacterium glaucum]